MRLKNSIAIALLLQCLNLAMPAAATDSGGWAVVYPGATEPGAPAQLTVSFSQSEAAGAPPGIVAPEWGTLPVGLTATIQSIEAESAASGTESRIVIGLTAQEAGEYAIPSFQIALLGQSEGPFETDAFSLKVRAANTEQWMAVLAGLVVLLVGGAVYLRQRRGARATTAALGQTRADRIAAKLHEARRYRLDGNFYAYYQALSDAAAWCDTAPDEDLAAKLRERTRQVGYQGLRPSDDELDSVMREVERASRRVNEEQTV